MGLPIDVLNEAMVAMNDGFHVEALTKDTEGLVGVVVGTAGVLGGAALALIRKIPESMIG